MYLRKHWKNRHAPWEKCGTCSFGLAIAATCFFGHVLVANAATPDELRLMTAAKKFSGTTMVAVAYRAGPPGWLPSHHLEWSAGFLHRASDYRPFLSIGPVWRLGQPDSDLFAEISISPAFLAGSTLGDRDLGGNFHFASALSVGRNFRGGWAVSMRLQHFSNAGIHRRNPGLDLVGVSVQKSFAD